MVRLILLNSYGQETIQTRNSIHHFQICGQRTSFSVLLYPMNTQD